MSRWNAESDLDYYDEPWAARPNAECSHCHVPFHRGQDDTGSLCDACCATRDATIEAMRNLRCEQLQVKPSVASKVG